MKNGDDNDLTPPAHRQRDSWFGRRDYLKIAGAAATMTAGAGVLSEVADAATTVHGMTFDRTVNVVEDLGVDPTGQDPVDSEIERAATDGTLFVFPEGEYLWAGTASFSDRELVGFQGSGNVRLVFPQGYNQYFFVARTRQVLFENFVIDIQADDTVTGMKVLCPEGFHVENVEFLGRGTHSDSRLPYALLPYVTSAGATGVVKNVVAKQGSAWAHYKGADGRGGIYVGVGHEGTLRVVDCHFEEFGNNGIYASGCPGDVQVIGGVYRNNNVAGVRFGGDGSYVEDALIEVDPAKYTGPRTREDRSFNMRGVVIAQKPEKNGFKGPGSAIRNCDIRVVENPSNTEAAVSIWYAAQTVEITDTRIRMDANSPAIARDGQDGTSVRPASDDPRWVRCENVSITGDAAGGAAIVLDDANGSYVTNSCLNQTGSNRDGIVFRSSNSAEVSDSTVDVTGTMISGADTVANITESGSCPLPSVGGGGDTGVAVSTDTPSSVGETNATFEGTLGDLGGASSADVAFEYREIGASSWATTTTQTLTSTGPFSEMVEGLTSGTDYEHRAVATASDDDTDAGTTVSFTTDATTTQGPYTDHDPARIEAENYDLGGQNVAYYDNSAGNEPGAYRDDDVDIEVTTDDQGEYNVGWIKPGEWLEYTVTIPEGTYDFKARISSTAESRFTVSIDGTDVSTVTVPNTGAWQNWETITGETLSIAGGEHVVRITADVSDYNLNWFGFVADPSVAVSTASPSAVGETNATLEGTLGDLGGASSADVAFEYRETGGDTWSTTPPETLGSPGAFSAPVDGLTPATEYELRSVAEASDGDTDSGSVVVFTTQSETVTNTDPVVDRYAVTEAGSPNPHADINVEWDVSDADGDLSQVLVQVRDSTGVVVDASRSRVSGETASNVDYFQIKKARGESFEVSISVTDAAGNEVTASRTVSER
jgi:hypothetical protein